MDIIKRHKGLAIIGGLTFILIIVMFAICARMIFSTGETEYGDRLNGIKKVDKAIINEIIDETKVSEMVEDIKIRTQGKIIYTKIKYKEGTNLDMAKEIASNTLLKYEEVVLGYYDFGFFLEEIVVQVEGEDEKKGFVIAGTKHPEIDKISWTKK